MRQLLEVTDFVNGLKEVGLPKLQEGLSRILKCRVIPLKLTVKQNYRKENYLEIFTDDLKDLLGDTLVHVMFNEITLNGTGDAQRQVISDDDDPEGEPVIFFNFGLYYTFPDGGRNGQRFTPNWLFWRVNEERWYVGDFEKPLDLT